MKEKKRAKTRTTRLDTSYCTICPFNPVGTTLGKIKRKSVPRIESMTKNYNSTSFPDLAPVLN